MPGLLLAIGIAALLGPRLLSVMIAIAAVNVPIFARLAARLDAGAAAAVTTRSPPDRSAWGAAAIVLQHVFPNSLAPVIVQGTLALATAIIDAAGLAYLGFGSADPSIPEWGRMLADTQSSLATSPLLALWPGRGDRAVGARLLPRRRGAARGARSRNCADERARTGVRGRRGCRVRWPSPPAPPLLRVRDLTVTFASRGRRPVRAVDGVSLDVAAGSTVGIVGESGSGKSVTSLASLGLLGRRGVSVTGSVEFDGQDLLQPARRTSCAPSAAARSR